MAGSCWLSLSVQLALPVAFCLQAQRHISRCCLSQHNKWRPDCPLEVCWLLMSVQLALWSVNIVRTDTTITDSDDTFKSTCCATSRSQCVIELYMMLIDYDANGVHLLAMLGQKQLVRMAVQFLFCMQSCLPLLHKCTKGCMQQHILQFVMIMNKKAVGPKHNGAVQQTA